ncbi:MAG TPA: glutamate synthase large subunit [Rectinemataceae bacterium]|nr:glutamate synthase large subunit [Rectinemataceae bacterium]
MDQHSTEEGRPPAGAPAAQGLYDPHREHDSCGIGFVVNIKGRRSHQIVSQSLTILRNMSHRGGAGYERNSGDGAGILTQIPHRFFAEISPESGIALGEAGSYGVGMVFLPRDPETRSAIKRLIETTIASEGLSCLGWREVPVDLSSLGSISRSVMPYICQVFVGKGKGSAACALDDMAFERKLYVVRKRCEKTTEGKSESSADYFYFASLSCKTVVYKGMFTPEQVEPFYLDLSHPAFETAISVVHSRFSTNTFPSWERAHPYRYLIHNGEINTLRGNVNWMHARESMIRTDLFGPDASSILPIINPNGSDSAMFDNTLEFLYLTGRPLPHAMMMMIPEPWSGHESMSDEKKAFYEYHATLIEPWDGPAAMAFTDGTSVGAVLDRNGLRPARYYVTLDDTVILASEVGVLDIPADRIARKERLQPGRMLLIDTKEGRIIDDEEIKERAACEHPYREWLDEHMVRLEDLPPPPRHAEPDHETVLRLEKAFGYTYEDLRLVLLPMVRDGVDPVGSMGNDTPLAVLSDKPQLLYNYFKQLFAQVTNPPIDAIREEIVIGRETFIGSEGDLVHPTPQAARQIKLSSPFIDNDELERLRHITRSGFRAVTIPITYHAGRGQPGAALERAMDEVCAKADEAFSEGANILILSDRGVSRNRVPIPALLAVSGLHHHLIRNETRTRVSIVLESGEPREIHHFSMLIGYGVSAINPYLVFEAIDDMIKTGFLPDVERAKAVKTYKKAVTKGVIKVMSKMGISTVQGYQGAQIFEAVGLSSPLVEEYFTGTPSRVGGIGMAELAREVEERHAAAFDERSPDFRTLPIGGDWQWRAEGEYHLYNPETVHLLQRSCREGDYRLFKRYAALIDDQSARQCTLRGLMKFRQAESVPLDEVESVESIVKRFKTGAMSFGSISKEAHEALAIAMNRLGGKSNTGEGGELSERFRNDPNGDSRCSAIKQVASGRFGVTSEYLVSAKEIQIKMAQGAKPGEGGQLPGRKVYPWIAECRKSTPGVGLISPPPHHDIYSIEDLSELIHDLKCANPEARISVKLVSEVGVGTIAAGVAKARADLVLISGYDGGTGASPRTSLRHAGLPWELGLAETHQTLLLNNLRSTITVETDGKLMTGRDVAIAAMLGAEEFGFATAPLVALGCVMMRVCNLDTCPAGIATQNPELRKNFSGRPEHVENFMRFIAQDLRERMAALGIRRLVELVGRTDLLDMEAVEKNPKTGNLDYSKIFHRPQVPAEWGRHCVKAQDHNLDNSLDRRVLLRLCEPALERGEKVKVTIPVRNVNRVVGTILGAEITRRYGAAGLPEDTIDLKFVGSAGQSFGAFIPPGVTLSIEGDSNDHLGKGLSGGKIIVYPPANSPFKPEENIIIGNVGFYGATSGRAYVCGMAGERFCVRNSGLTAVVEGVGDHACEYMTGGTVVILGRTGRNFGAGMSGGLAYVHDSDGDFPSRVNGETVDLEELTDPNEIAALREIIEAHARATLSARARHMLAGWAGAVKRFVKVTPRDYKRMLAAIEAARRDGLGGESALMAAFELNNRDLARVSGS